jgi:CRISPR-associated endoribonuclease Cas6
MTELKLQLGKPLTDRSELYSVVVQLHPVAPGWVCPGSGSQAHAAFLDILRQHDPALSERLHLPNQRRPFTVGPLHGFKQLSAAQFDRATRQGQKVKVEPNQVYWLRFTMLDGAMFGVFAQHFLKGWQTARLRIGETEFELSRLLTGPEAGNRASSWAAYASFEELVRKAKPQASYQFEFASPTAFSLGQQSWGKKMALLPEPGLVFDSLAHQWDSFAPPPLRLGADLPELVEWCKANLVVSQLQLETRNLVFKQYPQVGFVGQVTYERKGPVVEPFASWVSCLAAFALYAGVGYKTSMGMGQTRMKDEG